MSVCWDYEEREDSYKRFLYEEAKQASNDREVGLVGMSMAATEAKKLGRELGEKE